MKELKFTNKKMFIFGVSFGGLIAISLSLKLSDISGLILFSPLLDVSRHGTKFKEQDLNHLSNFVKKSYINLYNIKFNNFLMQINSIKDLNYKIFSKNVSSPMLIFHSPNDKSVSINYSLELVNKNKNAKLLKHSLEHGISEILLKKYWDKIDKFLMSNGK